MNRKDKITLLRNLKAGKASLRDLQEHKIAVLCDDGEGGFFDSDTKQKFTAIEVEKTRQNPNVIFVDL